MGAGQAVIYAVHDALAFGFVLAVSAMLVGAQTPPPRQLGEPKNPDARILGVIPNYQTVSDPTARVTPLTVRQKWALFARESSDPFNLVGAALGAGLSHADDAHPRYGQGAGALADRFGAATADMMTQNFFADVVLAPLFHQDPRYFRKGPSASIPARVAYAFSRLVITRQDSGRPAFNISLILGIAMGIALSNAYYPDPSVSSSVSAARLRSSMTGIVLGNLLPEFWPDVRARLFHRHHRQKGS